jgi:hypothetical protein
VDELVALGARLSGDPQAISLRAAAPHELPHLELDVAALLHRPITVMEHDGLLGIRDHPERLGQPLDLGVEALERGAADASIGVEEDVEVGAAHVRLGCGLGGVERVELTVGRVVATYRGGEGGSEPPTAEGTSHGHWQDPTIANEQARPTA